MNKEKLLEFINNQRKEHAWPQDNYGLGYFKALDDLESKIKAEPDKNPSFQQYFMNLYGEGLEVSNWHLNGDTEPLDTFIDSALESENEIIQSEPEEKTNFDVITESPEKLAYWLNIISGARTVFYPGTGEISFNDNGLIDWLNEKAGE